MTTMATSAVCPGGRTEVAVVVNARWHDTGYARAQLLAMLDEHDCAVVTVHDDFSDIGRLANVDAVVAYTCDVRPSPDQVGALESMLARGGRFLGLHATNSAIDAPVVGAERIFRTPDAMPEFTRLLGNRFLAHPKIAPYRIDVVDPDHGLVRGVDAFTTVDEIYVTEIEDDLHVILDVEYEGECPGFETGEACGRHPVLYTRADGSVTYFTLGHCRGRFDVSDLGIADLEVVDRIAWTSIEYREILRRCIGWSVHGSDFSLCPTKEKT